jgi:hypothetical protein
MADKLLVRAVGAILVVNYEALAAGARRFIGRTFLDGVGKQGGWPASAEVTSVPVTDEYLKSLRDGSLLACDEATAKAAGVAFDAAAAKKAAEESKEFWDALDAPTKVDGKSAPPVANHPDSSKDA